MDNPGTQFSIESLYNLTLDELCRSMSEEVMVHVLNVYPPLQVLQVIWKVRNICIFSLEIKSNYNVYFF